jgi:hypothetical protein
MTLQLNPLVDAGRGGTGPVPTGPTTPVRTVNTGAKDVPDLTKRLADLMTQADRADRNPKLDTLPGSVVGQVPIFRGVDASQTLILARSVQGDLSLYVQNFGLHPETGEPSLKWGSTYQKVATLGRAVTADGHFDNRMTAYEHFGAPKDPTSLKQSRYELALGDNGQLFVELPNTNKRHTVLAVTPDLVVGFFPAS